MQYNTIWTNNLGASFPCKADAFKWMNEVDISADIDMPKLYCNGEKRITKTPFGIFDEDSQTYVKGKLPVEYYN